MNKVNMQILNKSIFIKCIIYMDHHQKYLKYKTKYISLKNKEHLGGKKFTLLTEKEKKDIMEKYNTIIDGNKSCMKYPKKYVEDASKGMYLNEDHLSNKSQKSLCHNIKDVKKRESIPFVHNDSLTAWCHQAVINHGLEVGDILKMKFGDKMDVILIDRNVGEHTSVTKKGTKYDPTKDGLVYGTYIHSEDLCGILEDNDGFIHTPFKWEINGASLGKDYCFWQPIPDEIDIKKLNPKIKVGWRGPSLRKIDAIKYLPRQVTHYNDWWNDYVPFKYNDFLKLK